MDLSKFSGQNYIALLLIFLGAGFLLQSLGYFDFGWIIGQWWPALIIIFGIIEFSKPTPRKIVPALIILFGTILLFSRFTSTDVNFWGLFWPLILLFIGGSLLFRQKPDTSSLETALDTFTFMSGTEKRVKSKGFTGGSAVTLLGGTTIDLREATLAEGATLDVLVFAGGIEILLPEDCQVNNQVLAIAGGIEDKTLGITKSTQTLILTGTVLMGGIDIKFRR